jgi:hypothetical protein
LGTIFLVGLLFGSVRVSGRIFEKKLVKKKNL